MREQFDELNVKEMQGYIEDRTSVLNKVFNDHLIWEQSLREFGKDACHAATWVDHQGEKHVFAINQVYLKAHLKIVRSLMNDLIACGAEGKQALQGTLRADQHVAQEQTLIRSWFP